MRGNSNRRLQSDQRSQWLRGTCLIYSAALIALTSSNLQGGVFEIQSGAFRTIGGFAGTLDFTLPNSQQSSVRFEVDEMTNLAAMQFLDENLMPVDLFGVGTDFGDGVFMEGAYIFFDDTLAAPFDTFGTLDYRVSLPDQNTIMIDGTFDSAPGVCCDIIQSYAHLSVIAALSANPIVGDFNQDSRLDVADVDLLTTAIQGDDPELRFDLTQDGLVNAQDLEAWIKDIKLTWMGDANLDGEFNSSDLTQIFQSGEYEDGIVGNSTWSEGDWNGNGDFTSTDLVVAFDDGGYELGPRRDVAVSVPEPDRLSPVVPLFFLLIALRRKRSDGSAIEL